MKMNNKKIRRFVVILLLIAIIMTFSSCGTELSLADSFDIVLNKDYIPQERIVENLVELEELENYNFSESKGEFMTFTKVENDASISKAVFNTRNNKVVLIVNSTLEENIDIKLASNVPAFTVVKTKIVDENGVSDIKSVCELYDASGAYVVQASGESVLPIAFADTVIFDNVAYSVNPKNGTLTKIADVFELIYADGCDDWNDEYFCTYGETVNIYSRAFERVYTWQLPAGAKLISNNMLNNGNVILQYAQPLDADADEYDFYETDEINGETEKFELFSVLINAEKKSEKKVEFDYVIEQITSEAELARAAENEKMYSDKVENIAYIYPLCDGIIDYSEKSADIVLMDNKGKIKKSLKLVEEQRAALPMCLGDDVYMVSTFYGYALVDIDGNVLNKINNTEIDVVGENIIIDNKIYSLAMKEVYTLDENSTILGYCENMIFVKNGTDEIYDIFTIEGENQEEICSYNPEKPFELKLEFLPESATYCRSADTIGECIYFNTNHKVIGGLDLRLKKVVSDFGNNITVYCTEFNGYISYYTIY